jgi:hypothetical protein
MKSENNNFAGLFFSSEFLSFNFILSVLNFIPITKRQFGYFALLASPAHKLCRGCLFFIFIMTSCISEEISYKPAPKPDDPVKSGYMKIRLNMPDLHIPSKTNRTRAMDDQAENDIIPDYLDILVFSYNDDGEGNITETFNYIAKLSGSIVYDENDFSKATVIVELINSSSANDLYRIVVVANHDFPNIDMVKNVTTKEEIMEQLTFLSPGKWSAGNPYYAQFPMWGESVPLVLSNNMPSPTIDLYRALARIDVGFNFVMENGKLTEQAYGIPDFMLSAVYVFRTYNKSYVAPVKDYTIKTPSIPPGASRFNDNSPLKYIDIEGVNSYTREIYVLESDLPAIPDNDNIHCLVIQGYYKNSSDVSYYRLDFAKEADPWERTYLPILRNHRYVFNITQVVGPGFPTITSALESTPTVGNVDYDLIAWDGTIHEMETQGQYYFGIDNRDLLAEVTSTSSDPNNKFAVKYQTNYPLSTSDPIRLAWASVVNDPFSSPLFDAQWQPGGKNILITAINDNLTNVLLSDTLYVYAGPFVKKIVVMQKCSEETIRPVIPHMNILVIAYPNNSFGYSISDVRAGVSKVFNSQNNFGPNDNSTIKVDGFSFISSSTYMFESFDTENLRKWVTGVGNDGKIADIVYFASYAMFNNPTTVQLLVDYMDKGGVVVIFNEEHSVRHLVNAVLNVDNIINVISGNGGSVYPFPAHPFFDLNGNALQDVLDLYENDPILNGPFGDVRDKQWGEDGNPTMTLDNMPLQDPNLTVYSYQIDISKNSPVKSKLVNGFKYESEKRNMVWFGDGGFIASYKGEVDTNNDQGPLSWDPVTFYPVPRIGYGTPKQMSVYNSTVFCNIMAWAILKSDSLREERNKAK